MKIPCSNCNQRLEIPEELAGQTIECPACNASLAVPALLAPPPTAPRVEVATPQVSAQLKPVPQRKTAAQPKTASSQNSKSPIPMEAIASAAGVVVVVLILMFSSRPTVLILGTTLIIVGSIVAGVAAIVLLIANFKKDVVWGLLNFVSCGIPMNVFAIMHFREVKKTYLAYLASMAVAFVGYAITASVAISATSDAVSATVDFLEKYSTNAIQQPQSLKPPTAEAPDISIHEAAGAHSFRKANIEAVKQHLAAGTDVNAKDWVNRTPLYYATIRRHKEIAELLIANGADVNAKDSQGETPLDLADFSGPEIADLLRKHGGKSGGGLRAPIHVAAGATGRKGNIEAVKQYLAAGTDVDARDAEDKTPLQHAAYWGHKEIAELLIAEGADVNAKDNAGTTTLDWAKNKPEIADLLRKHGGKTGEELKAEGN